MNHNLNPFNSIISSPSQSTQQLQELQKRVPVVSDKALIDLVNGIQVSKDLIRYRKQRGFFGQLIDTLDGSDRTRQILLDGNLVAGQEALSQWVLELSDSLRISHVALEVTQKSLLEARNAIREQKQSLQAQKQAILALGQHLEQLAKQVNTRFNQMEARIRNLEVRIAANEDLDRIITAWTAGQTYTNLPWVVQITLLSRELFSSAIATYELETGDSDRFRPLAVNKILSASQEAPKNFFGLADLLDSSWESMISSDRVLSATLLEIRSIPSSRLQQMPLLFTLGSAMELATLPTEARPSKPGQAAIALCRTHIDTISRTTDARDLVTTIVEETARDCLAMMSRR